VSDPAHDRAERFLHLFNQIDEHLREMALQRRPSGDRHASFGSVVREVSKFNGWVRDSRDDLIEFADLRNALVHTAGLNGVRYLAEPYPEVIDRFERLVASITNPKRAGQIGTWDPRRFAPGDSLENVIAYMSEAGHGQIVVQGNGPAALLSSRGISNWVGQNIRGGSVKLAGVRLADVLPHEPEGSFDIIRREMTIDDIRSRFLALLSPNGERLLALIVTHSGKPTEKALGIITAWDVVNAED